MNNSESVQVYIKSYGFCGEFKGHMRRFICVDVFGTIYYYLDDEIEFRSE